LSLLVRPNGHPFWSDDSILGGDARCGLVSRIQMDGSGVDGLIAGVEGFVCSVLRGAGLYAPEQFQASAAGVEAAPHSALIPYLTTVAVGVAASAATLTAVTVVLDWGAATDCYTLQHRRRQPMANSGEPPKLEVERYVALERRVARIVVERLRTVRGPPCGWRVELQRDDCPASLDGFSKVGASPEQPTRSTASTSPAPTALQLPVEAATILVENREFEVSHRIA